MLKRLIAIYHQLIEKLVYMNLLGIIPIFCFFTSVLLGFMDNSFSVFKKYNIPFQKKNYGYSIPLKEIKHNIKNIENICAKNELKKCVRFRIFQYIFLISTFVSMGFVSYFTR